MTTLRNARRLRRIMSPPEVKLWQYLRTRPNGFQFRRQHVSPPYILDFYCRAAALAIEADGAAHEMGGNPARDARRDDILAERGIKTLRFSAADVMRHFDAVAVQIVSECASRTPSTGLRRSPSPRKRGEE